jgi:formylglycine-generating enzyme required for sulfatase activity
MPDRLRQFAGEVEREAANAQAAENQGKLRTAITGYRRATMLLGLNEELSLPMADGVRLLLVFVPAGEFDMGSSPDDGGRRKEEHLPQTVVMKKAFYIGKYEVTQEQYKTVVDRNPSAFQGLHLPADSVSWHEAEQFCADLTKRLNSLGYGQLRLPTEREWEYACRAGTRSEYSAGDGKRAMEKVGWCRQDGSRQTKPVGQKEANIWGLCDMHGNVWEWCHDTFVLSRVPAIPEPDSQDGAARRVLRGGSWNTDLSYCRSASRYGEAPQTKRDDIGFRVVMEIE